jgi:hypothetical protein
MAYGSIARAGVPRAFGPGGPSSPLKAKRRFVGASDDNGSFRGQLRQYESIINDMNRASLRTYDAARTAPLICLYSIPELSARSDRAVDLDFFIDCDRESKMPNIFYGNRGGDFGRSVFL